MWQMAVAWTPYFAVTSADQAAGRVQERGGTSAVGPISLPPGRAALLADRDGATFGVWEGELFTDWETWRRAQPAFIKLHTRDAFDAAIFYGEVLDWASGRPGACEVGYEGGEVVLRSNGDVVARIESGALEAAPDPTIRPHWQVHFFAADVAACARAAELPAAASGVGAGCAAAGAQLQHRRVAVSPSAPQFQDRLWLSPSALSSPLASLCLSLYETRSRRVKPSCAVTKLTLARGRRRLCWYRSEEPVSRDANSPSVWSSPRQKSAYGVAVPAVPLRPQRAGSCPPGSRPRRRPRARRSA
ncbi:hypothetical protein SFUMM280S_00292 [Streptomyces fumanus]